MTIRSRSARANEGTVDWLVLTAAVAGIAVAALASTASGPDALNRSLAEDMAGSTPTGAF